MVKKDKTQEQWISPLLTVEQSIDGNHFKSINTKKKAFRPEYPTQLQVRFFYNNNRMPSFLLHFILSLSHFIIMLYS